MDYFKSKGIKTWGELADYFGIHLFDLVGDEYIDYKDELFDCMILDDFASQDAIEILGQAADELVGA